MRIREIVLLAIVLLGVTIVTFGWFQSRGEKANAAASARTLQQWGIALNLYLIDNENQLPETGETPVTAEQTLAWYNALPPYLGQTALTELPPGSRPKPGALSLWIIPGAREPRAWDDEVFYFNYAMNQFLQPDANMRSFRIYEIDHPANVVFMTEVDAYEPAVTPGRVAFRFGPGGASPRAIANVLFCDGHVEPLTRARLEDPNARLAATAETGVSWFEN